MFDLKEKLHHAYDSEFTNDITVEFDALKLTQENFQIIVNLADIIKDSGEIGTMELDIFKFNINKIEDYSKDLITCKR